MYKLSSRIDNMGRDKSINLRRFALGQILFHHHRSKKGRFEEKQKKFTNMWNEVTQLQTPGISQLTCGNRNQ